MNVSLDVFIHSIKQIFPPIDIQEFQHRSHEILCESHSPNYITNILLFSDDDELKSFAIAGLKKMNNMLFESNRKFHFYYETDFNLLAQNLAQLIFEYENYDEVFLSSYLTLYNTNSIECGLQPVFDSLTHYMSIDQEQVTVNVLRNLRTITLQFNSYNEKEQSEQYVTTVMNHIESKCSALLSTPLLADAFGYFIKAIRLLMSRNLNYFAKKNFAFDMCATVVNEFEIIYNSYGKDLTSNLFRRMFKGIFEVFRYLTNDEGIQRNIILSEQILPLINIIIENIPQIFSVLENPMISHHLLNILILSKKFEVITAENFEAIAQLVLATAIVDKEDLEIGQMQYYNINFEQDFSFNSTPRLVVDNFIKEYYENFENEINSIMSFAEDDSELQTEAKIRMMASLAFHKLQNHQIINDINIIIQGITVSDLTPIIQYSFFFLCSQFVQVADQITLDLIAYYSSELVQNEDQLLYLLGCKIVKSLIRTGNYLDVSVVNSLISNEYFFETFEAFNSVPLLIRHYPEQLSGTINEYLHNLLNEAIELMESNDAASNARFDSVREAIEVIPESIDYPSLVERLIPFLENDDHLDVLSRILGIFEYACRLQNETSPIIIDNLLNYLKSSQIGSGVLAGSISLVFAALLNSNLDMYIEIIGDQMNFLSKIIAHQTPFCFYIDVYFITFLLARMFQCQLINPDFFVSYANFVAKMIRESDGSPTPGMDPLTQIGFFEIIFSAVIFIEEFIPELNENHISVWVSLVQNGYFQTKYARSLQYVGMKALMEKSGIVFEDSEQTLDDLLFNKPETTVVNSSITKICEIQNTVPIETLEFIPEGISN